MTTPHGDQARTIPPCPICGGARLGNFILSGQFAGIRPVTKPPASQQPLSTLAAVVCLTCGNVELGAHDLPRIRQLAEEHPERFTY